MPKEGNGVSFPQFWPKVILSAPPSIFFEGLAGAYKQKRAGRLALPLPTGIALQLLPPLQRAAKLDSRTLADEYLGDRPNTF